METAAEMATRMPMTMKVLTMVRLVLMPARLAASGFPPIEKT